ncbi:restriction endonuclease subunit S [Salmonella enterica subsp. enterica serovar Derby]|uniref:Restriction endonuclease subunit S n=19 Tax=Salmonella enterica TaxID=28901 RepID=A0A5Z7EPM1_SALER|nr:MULTISPECIES: restriction endonuclease subunit S [Salmonella]EAY2767307.1 restriction endonuclease subunit S [Salmonella enterica subsp. enterica serovar Typhimurium]EBE3860064.1 restriction endonuclease subunit S [Salmonella enterica subsp. enterica serovar Agona]EBP4034867.1 restriction endonuclease subunit S [Salmonella enterica subsp. salamae]EBW8715926.1 restriction endonuclease subunit S [Salmonella enterica subsp. enterica serovar Oranienburg]EDS5960602.1 restriction endonuclease sub
MAVEKLIVDHIDTWTTALQTRSTAGRGSSGKIDLYGIKKLRELILELAVRGKLVPQDPNDEPASVLLERIAAEKAELMKQGKIKKQKPLPEISEEEKPFELPVGWEWTRLINLGTWALGSGFPNVVQGNSDKEILMCKVSDMNLEGNEKFIVSTINTISKDLADEYKIKTSEPGTIIFPKIGGAIATNKRRILVQETAIDNNCLGIKPCNAISGEWFYLILSALDMSKYQSGTSIPAINQSVIGSIPIALPSLKMQEKILSYVITLMSLCDQLELHSLTSLDAHQQLVETLLTTLTDSQNADELAENWSRISEHFDTLFTTEASIDALKQTILQLAVMGKLVPQDPNDEPASELLKRIAQEKAQLVKDGKMKKQKPLPPISDEEKPFELPDGWEWVKLGNILHDIKYGTSQKCDYNISGYPVLRIPNIVKGIIDLADIKYGALTDSELKDLTLNKNDLLFIRSNGSTNIVGQSTLVQHDLKDHAYAGYIIRVRLHNEYINARYINMIMKSNLIREQIEGPIRTTTGVKNINSNELMGLLVPLPPKNEQGIIIKKINEIDTTLSNLKVSIQSAQQTQVHLADALTDAAIN